MPPGRLAILPYVIRVRSLMWSISHPDDLTTGSISSEWLMDTALCHPDDISYHHMSCGWLRWHWSLIRISYDNVIMSSGWHAFPFLSHPDEIANFDFPQHAVAFQRFRTSVPVTRHVMGWKGNIRFGKKYSLFIVVGLRVCNSQRQTRVVDCICVTSSRGISLMIFTRNSKLRVTKLAVIRILTIGSLLEFESRRKIVSEIDLAATLNKHLVKKQFPSFWSIPFYRQLLHCDL